MCSVFLDDTVLREVSKEQLVVMVVNKWSQRAITEPSRCMTSRNNQSYIIRSAWCLWLRSQHINISCVSGRELRRNQFRAVKKRDPAVDCKNTHVCVKFTAAAAGCATVTPRSYLSAFYSALECLVSVFNLTHFENSSSQKVTRYRSKNLI